MDSATRRHDTTTERSSSMSYRAFGGTRRFLAAFTLVAALAFLGAASASAAEFRAGAEEAQVKATNSGNHVFTAGLVGNISCTEATFTGELVPTPAKTLDVLAAYNNCTFLGVSGVKVTMNGCKYHFQQPEGSGPFTGKVDIVNCTEGKPITFGTASCTVTVPEQSNLSQVKYTNQATSPKTVKVESNVTGITYTATGVCNGFPGTHSDGVYTGTAIAKAFNEAGEQVDAFIE
jgi:hypothetical protein